ncbi:thioesterase II family protein [Streptomyces hoynatensis]|uniref:Thioesterase n=1 Tax=Streptomyces hoynatensis TaxID=1141874 RepID=A0A3A9Z9F8_9ACTN|nr:alpha/beta fold hydrolase [Streptomyces hoynatensis]RKN44893.1 thioesterase [Streptomyces hoynatensis]
MTETPGHWLRCTRPRPGAGGVLVCFPHAGGSASFFRDWGGALPEFEVHAVRYPGRAERIDEPPPTDLRALARDIAGALAPLGARRLVLFGHSMGAAVALEAALALESGGVPVTHLFASGSRDAPLPEPGPEPEAPPDDEALIRSLVALGGTDAEPAADPLFRELVLPYVRADTEMFHSYDGRVGSPLRCPVTAIAGDRDEDADRRPWSALTRGGFAQHVVPGGHFYLRARPPFALVRTSLDPTTSRRRQSHHGR